MMAVMDGFKRLFAQRDLRVRWLRNAGMQQLNRIPLVKRRIVRQAMGL
jgi:2-octaprenylphenol hydroxylase